MFRRKVKTRALIVVLKQPYRGDNAFGVLGVSPDASIAEIKRAYVGLARKYHPDRNHSPDAREQFIRINQAYTYIMKHGDLLELQLMCGMAEVKATYSEFLQIHKRAKVLAGVEIEPPAPPPGNVNSSELGRKMQELGVYMITVCPGCRNKDKCDRATGFAEVEEIHRELQEAAGARAMKAVFGSLTSLFNRGRHTTR